MSKKEWKQSELTAEERLEFELFKQKMEDLELQEESRHFSLQIGRRGFGPIENLQQQIRRKLRRTRATESE